ATILLVAAVLSTFAMSPLSAAADDGGSSYPVVSGFSTPDGAGFWLVLVGGSVSASGKAGLHGDASYVWGNGQFVGGTPTPSGRGYWLDSTDGGVFSYGDAHFYGSMGGKHLNQPVTAIAPTKSGNGYWLVAGDGGVFTFGDAPFFGSTGELTLAQPVVGITTRASGRGYRLVARDGGIFTFGDARFYGSVPGRGIRVTDTVGMATTPSGKGYWIARSSGEVYGFGNAHPLGNYVASPCDPVVAILANSRATGYRLVMQSGASVPFGNAPGVNQRTGTPFRCSSSIDVVTPTRIGPLQLGVATESEVRAHLGTPDATAIGNYGVSFPNFRALGYNCSTLQIPGGITLHPYDPSLRGPFCRTVYYLNNNTQTLAGFNTTRTDYTTARGTTVGMTMGEAQLREREPFYPLGCFVGIWLGYQTASPQIFLFATGRNLGDQVGEIGVDNNSNSVGVLFC
ncbi:MAG: hypothetical protein QOI44_393, partial [Actinomycetota bacterium]|nr:hypothetical protein [Actinomycetota bacterium]